MEIIETQETVVSSVVSLEDKQDPQTLIQAQIQILTPNQPQKPI